MDKQLAIRCLGLRDKSGNFVSIKDVFGTKRWIVSFTIEMNDRLQKCFDLFGVDVECVSVPPGYRPPTGSLVFYDQKGDVFAWAHVRGHKSASTTKPKPTKPKPPTRDSATLDVFPRTKTKPKKKGKKKIPDIDPVSMSMLKDELLETAAKLNLGVDDTWTKAELVELINDQLKRKK